MRYREILEACWKGYHKEGMKTMFGKRYPNCVKNKTTNEDQISNEKVRRIQNFLNDKFGANLDVDGVLGPLTIKSIDKFMPDAQKRLAPEPDKTTRVQGLEKKLDESELEEDLRKWFKEKWVRFGPDGKIRGDCARGSSKEGKPKCLPQSKAHSLGKKGRASAAAKKRREDPNPERRGAAKNVATKVREQQTIEGFGASTPAGEKILNWQNTKLSGRQYGVDGYTIKFTPEALLIYKGPDIVYKKIGDYSNPTNQHLVKARRMITLLLQGWKQSVEEQQLDELQFLGSECTKDCSGHRAGYNWSKAQGGVDGMSPWSPSFNKGAALAKAGK
jgi:hypothetical protein